MIQFSVSFRDADGEQVDITIEHKTLSEALEQVSRMVKNREKNERAANFMTVVVQGD